MTNQFKSLDEWLNWQQDLHPKNIDFKIERIKSVYDKLKIKQIAKKTIIVAGTNGKGSTVAILESLLHESKFKVGSFTSPHILKYNERIKISKQNIEDNALMEAFKVIDSVRGDTTLTYFEFATLAAFYIFSKHKLDFAILEVGLGGRLDATNIIDSDLSIITSIGIDHTEFLGSSIDSIANEKAGVMRSSCYSIFAGSNPPATLLSNAQSNNVRLIFGHKHFSHNIYNNYWEWRGMNGTQLKLPLLPLTGDFQYNHASAALQAIEIIDQNILNNMPLLAIGLENVSLMGRYQKCSKHPEVIIDVAHNEDSAVKLFDNLNQEDKKRTYAVIGLLNDKDAYTLIKPLTPIIEKWFIGTVDSVRGMNSSEIKERVISLVDNDKIACFENMNNAFEAAYGTLYLNDRLIIYGSFYTVAEFMNYQKHTKKKLLNE